MVPIAALVIIIVVIAAAAARSRETRNPGAAVGPNGRTGRIPAVAWDTERIFIYALSFAGLLATLYAVAGLIATVIVTVTQQSNVLIGASEMRDRTSYYLASGIVGLPVWLGLWSLAQRRITRSNSERQARERRIYLAGIFAVCSVVALFGLHTVLATLLTLPGTANRSLSLRDAIFAAARFVIWGAAWLFYSRIGWRERIPQDHDEPHDLAVYVLSAFSLVFLGIGLGETVRLIAGDLISVAGTALLSPAGMSLWEVWGEIVAWIMAGGAVWVAIWRYDLLRGGLRTLRVLYLYIVVLAAAAATLVGGVDVLYELLRRLFGYQTANSWSFLPDFLPPLLVGATVWAYHWKVMRRQSAFKGERDLPVGAIPWPRHPAIAILDLVGLAMAASAFTSLLWLALDLALNSGVALSGGAWWRDRASIALAAGLVGGAIWLSSWSLLQRSAAAEAAARGARIRRRLLGLIVIVGALVAVGFTVALLWTAFNAILSNSFDTTTLSRLLKDLSAVLISLAITAYHGVILRRERQSQPQTRQQLRLLALAAPGTEAALADLARGTGYTIELIGGLTATGPQTIDTAGVGAALNTLQEQKGIEGSFLILRPDGVTLYPYAREPAPEPVPAPTPEPPRSLGDSAINPA